MPTFAVASGRSSSARENDRVSYSGTCAPAAPASRRPQELRSPAEADGFARTARLPAGLVLREAGVARHPMGRTQHPRTGVRAIAVATLTNRSKELDARPARPVL